MRSVCCQSCAEGLTKAPPSAGYERCLTLPSIPAHRHILKHPAAMQALPVPPRKQKRQGRRKKEISRAGDFRLVRGTCHLRPITMEQSAAYECLGRQESSLGNLHHLGTFFRNADSGSMTGILPAKDYPPPGQRKVITLCVLAGAFMTQLDTTIANVALPHMQASTSASREQIAWVLTSYIIMAAIFTPLSGWLAQRFGAKRIMLISLAGFTGASMLCGIAANLEQLIAFRMLQGVMGSALLPISQAIILNINPRERHGSAMAIWGMGAILGPIIGPLLGGWLTENFNWRWVFFINLPLGIAAIMGLLLTMQDKRDVWPARFDLLGFAMLALAIGAFQLMLDRGQVQDWFQSREIWIEATIAAAAFYIFIVHSLTSKAPFFSPALFRDTNFVVGNVFGFFLVGAIFGVMALLAPMLAELMNYPIETIGMVTAPRGIGTMTMMLIGGRLFNRVDFRLLILAGLALTAVSMLMMSGSSLAMDNRIVIASGFIQGLGAGTMFVPIATIAFATLNDRYRNEAAAFNSLIRSLGGAIWISVLQALTIRNAETVHARLTEGVRPDNPVMAALMPDFDFTSLPSLAAMQREILRQSLMVSYIDSFWLILLTCFAMMPLLLFLRLKR
jgi:DHA2 family multidrug resistance protein